MLSTISDSNQMLSVVGIFIQYINICYNKDRRYYHHHHTTDKAFQITRSDNYTVILEVIYISLLCYYGILLVLRVDICCERLQCIVMMSVSSATAAASTRPRKDSRTTSPKVRSMTPKQSGVEGLEDFQRKRSSTSKSAVNDCCIICIIMCLAAIIQIFHGSPG